MITSLPSLEPGCPWYELSEWAKPNVKWCEEQVCGWIVEPANTWSNLSFIAFALAMAYMARNDSKGRATRYFAPAALLVGLTSFLYHMSYTFVFQVLDFTGMFIFCYLIITLNARRAGRLSAESQPKWYWGMVIGSTLLIPLLHWARIPYQGLILLLILCAIGSEAALHLRDRRKRYPVPSYKFWWLTIGTMAASFTFSLLDVTRVLCDPSNHWFQGHAMWHVLNGLALFWLFLFYRQFKES